MDKRKLVKIVKHLIKNKKGILAADESTNTIKKRFEKINFESTEENRRRYRELLFTTPKIKKYISGVILFDETVYQSDSDGINFIKLLNKKNIKAGIKLDLGTEFFENNEIEKYTLGLEDLDERIKEYKKAGIEFAKWRAVFSIGEKIPSKKCINKNAGDLAKYALICQENGIVPIVEPEVLMDGNHDIDKCFDVTKNVLKQVFVELKKKDVCLEGILLKPNMVIAGSENKKNKAEEVAQKTIECFREVVPNEVGGIVFLSGGQSEDEACQNLNAMTNKKIFKKLPWKLSYSFGRALQNSALETWTGKEENFIKAQEIFLATTKKVSQASQGKL